jgi:hypothetical protein
VFSHPVAGGTGGNASIAARSGPIRSAGAQPRDRFGRRLAISSHAWSWVLKSRGHVKLRPGRKDRSK